MLGENIKRLRIQKGLSRTELAHKSSVNYRSIENIEKGKTKNPGIVAVQKISEVLEVPVDVLLGKDIGDETFDSTPGVHKILRKDEIRALLKVLEKVDLTDLRKLLYFLTRFH